MYGSVTGTTGQLAAGQGANLDVQVGAMVMLGSLQVGGAKARVRGYATPTDRANDTARPVTTFPMGTEGLLFEFAFSDTFTLAQIQRSYLNSEAVPTKLLYLRVENTATASATLTATIVRSTSEA